MFKKGKKLLGLKILTDLFSVLLNNKMELWIDELRFLYTKKEYLDQSISKEGIHPTNSQSNRGNKSILNSTNP